MCSGQVSLCPFANIKQGTVRLSGCFCVWTSGERSDTVNVVEIVKGTYVLYGARVLLN